MPPNQDLTAFPELDDAQIVALSKFATLKSFQAGETLFAAGERDFKFFIVKSGEVAIVDHSSGQDKIVTIHEPKEFTGDVDMLTGRVVLVSAIARSACEVYEISAADLRRILSEMPSVSDILLSAFLMRRQLLEESGFVGIRVVGSRYSQDTHRIREFLAKNTVPFTWIDLENDPRVDTLLAQFQLSADETPVVACSGKAILRNPSSAQLADCLGIRKPLELMVYDLVAIGAGPAGLAAAVYGASEGLKTLVLDMTGPGGQAGASSRIENYMGFPNGLSGADLANRAVLQAQKFGATLSAPTEVLGLHSENGYHLLQLENGQEVSAKCVLISTGASYRKLTVDGCEQLEGRGVYYAATAVEAQLCRGAPVVIVGGGNSAGQAAVYLSERASKVLLLIRGGDLGKNMSHYLTQRIDHTNNIEVRRFTEISEIHGVRGDEALAAVELTCSQPHQSDTVACLAIFVFIGAVPHTTWLQDTIQLDKDGFVKTGLQVAEPGVWPLRRQPFLLETSRPGIFAAGDVRCGSIKRVASAVGEGSMAVQ
ncbi:MAG: FAD-dependent oxidoreductase, partial [Nitrococcus sp.]|nr:FAD-dependent oxidoreductase [Nitrococcus sp.]